MVCWAKQVGLFIHVNPPFWEAQFKVLGLTSRTNIKYDKITHTQTHTHTHIYIYIYICAHVHTCAYIIFIYIYIYVCVLFYHIDFESKKKVLL